MNCHTDSAFDEVARQRLVAALEEILEAPHWERRAEQRLPYFGPVSVSLPEEPTVNVSAFARDISWEGIGLVHLMPLKESEVVVHLPLSPGRNVTLLVDIRWCRDYKNGWCASGGRLLDVIS